MSVLMLADTASARDPLDGTYVMIGPVAAAAFVADEWVSAVGGELSVVNVVESRFPAAMGLTAGGVSYAGRPGGRLWLEAEVATGAPVPVGLGLGVATEVDPVRPYRAGAQATLWIFTGIVPFVRAGAVRETGVFFEAGVMLKIPARRFP